MFDCCCPIVDIFQDYYLLVSVTGVCASFVSDELKDDFGSVPQLEATGEESGSSKNLLILLLPIMIMLLPDSSFAAAN